MDEMKERNLKQLRSLIEEGKKVPKVMVFQDADGFDVEYEICAEEGEEGEEENDSQVDDMRQTRMYQSQMLNEQQSDYTAKGSHSTMSNKFNSVHIMGKGSVAGPQRPMVQVFESGRRKFDGEDHVEPALKEDESGRNTQMEEVEAEEDEDEEPAPIQKSSKQKAK